MGTGSNKFWLWVLTGVLTLVLVVVLNLALTSVRMFWDMTKDQRFTLPDAARSVAASVDDTLLMTLYLSEDLPGGFKHLPRVLRARIEEFREASGGRIEYQFIDPKGDDELIAELKTRKIEPVQGQDRTEGKISVGQYWLWVVMRFGDQESQVNLAELGGQILQSEEALSSVLPYFIASRIVKLQNPDTKIGVVSEKKMVPAQLLQAVPALQQLYGQNPTDGITSFRKQIESHYPALQDVSLKNGAPVPDGIQTLVVYRPENLSPREVYEIDHFLMKGKRVVVLLDNFPYFEIDKLQEWSQGKQQNEVPVRELRPALGEWLAHYGVMVEPGYVADDANAKVRQQEMRQQVVQGRDGRPITLNVPSMRETDAPGYVIVREMGDDRNPSGQFAAESPVVAGLGMISMLYPVPLLVDPAWRQRQPEAELDVLLETSSQAWVNEIKDGKVPVSGGHADGDTARGSRPLLVHVHGMLESYFADREVPVKTAPDGRELPAGPGDDGRAKFARSEALGHLMVFADSDFLQDLMPQLTRDAREAAMGIAKMQVGFVNALDSITLGDDLVQIRRPVLTDLSVSEKKVDEERGSILWWTVWFAPVLLILLGLLWLIARSAATRVASPARIARVSDFGHGAPGSPAAASPTESAAASKDETDQEGRP